MTCCPHCGGTGLAPDRAEALNITSTLAALRAACVAIGAKVTGDGRVDEETAALLIGRKRKTLCNWRHIDRPIPFRLRHRRVEYDLADLARWMRENDEMPDF